MADMQQAMAEGRVTSRQLVEQYLQRIALYEERLNATIAVNPKALEEADRLDAERRAGTLRGPLHGIPVALKDNVLTTDAMPTTGGMLLFRHYPAPYGATLATTSRRPAPSSSPSHDERAGRLVRHRVPPRRLQRGGGPGYTRTTRAPATTARRCSRRADRAPAVAWRRTSGPATSARAQAGPSRARRRLPMLVGIRPSTGRISRYGIVPLSLDQDTAGPMTKTVTIPPSCSA
jgi:amidase